MPPEDRSNREIAPFRDERARITRVLKALYGPEAEAGYAELRLKPGHPGVKVPLSLLDVLASACYQMQFGAAVELHSLPGEVTREQAARLLAMEQDALDDGLASGELPSHMSNERRVQLEDVLVLLRQRRGGTTASLRELATDSDG